MDEPRSGGPHGLLGVGLFTRSARASRLAARAGASATGSVGASGRGGVVLTFVLLSLAAILGAGLACHVPQPSVGTGGRTTTDYFSALDHAYDMLIQSDGKIVLVGDINPKSLNVELYVY